MRSRATTPIRATCSQPTALRNRKYLTLADETRATAFQTVLRPLEDRHLVACGVKKGCREEAAERATSYCDFERVHWSELPIQ